MQNTLPVKKQLTLAFGLLVLLMAAISLLAISLLQRSDQNFATYVNGVNARALLAEQIRTAVDRRAIAARNLTLLRPADDTAPEYAEILKSHQDVQDRIARLRGLIADAKDSTPEAKGLADTIAEVESRYGPVALSITELANRRATGEAAQKILDDCRPLLVELIAATNAYRDYTARRSEKSVLESQSQYGFHRDLLIGCAALALALALLSGWAIIRSLSTLLGSEPAALSRIAQGVAAGDLSDVQGAGAALPSSVLASLVHMQKSLAATVYQVRAAADSILSGSAEIAAGNAELSRRTEEQASALEETAATMDQIAGTIQQNAENAAQASVQARHSLDVVEKSNRLVMDVVDSMATIDRGSKRIADIVDVIDGIAFQTNLLALNAAVEAARAGEQGKGFAVVASEVRNLAQRSASAATEIKQLIQSSVGAVDDGVRLAQQAGASMNTVAGSVGSLAQLVGEISTASQDQAVGVSQVGKAIGQIDHATQQNASLVEEAAAAADSLKLQAERLVASVRAFSLEGRASQGPLGLGGRQPLLAA